MQDGDISSIEFHKVLQEVEKYCKLRANIRNQAKTDHKRTVGRIACTRKKERVREFFANNRKYFRYLQGVNAI